MSDYKRIHVKLTFTEPVLGTVSANEDIHSDYIASKAPDAPKMEEEIEAVGLAEVIEKSMTIFPRDKDGNPIFWDYQIKGFFKDACSALRKVSKTKSSKIKAYKKDIDGHVFPFPRQIVIHLPDGERIRTCERPLRASTPQGERIALASSEEIPAGSWLDFEVMCLTDEIYDAVYEWLDYGELRGIGQWRNSGKGRFVWDEVEKI